MNKFLIGAAALVIAGAAAAQGMQPPVVQTPPGAMPPHHMDMGGKTRTRAEVVAKVQQHFAMMDSNRDGAIAADEMQSLRGRRWGGGRGGEGNMAMRNRPMADPGAMFDRLDANRDGSISRDEFAKGREVRIERKVVMNGARGGAERRGMKMQGMRGGMRQGGGHMLRMADANKDGHITLPEMTAVALQRFDRTDANRDGTVTREERKAMHQQMLQQRGRNAG